MKRTSGKWVVKAVGAGTLVLVLATPSFAQSRDERRREANDGGRTQSSRRDGGEASNGTYRENQRVTAEGRVSSFKKEGGGYRVQLERGRASYYVPESYFRNRNRGLRVGLSIRLGGIFRGGSVRVDAVNWPDERGYDNYRDGYLAGVVDRVDVRSRTLWLRDNRTGALVAAEMRGSGRQDDLRYLRRGDYVELSGDWLRGGVFNVSRIEDIRNGRY